MGKRVYRVKKGDDFIKISRKLYGNASYVMDLMRANPGFYRLGKGMVLRLPKEDPRLTRKRKIKRRMKDYVPPPEETGDTTNQAIPSEGETGNGEESGAELSQSGESLGWDPAFEDEIINSIAETAKKMGLDADVMADELGISEGHLPSKEESSKDWTQSRTEKGNLHSPRTSPSRKPQSQTGDGSQIPMEVPSPLPTLTDEQIDALKEELEKLGLDVDVAMEELGLGEGAAASTTATQTMGEGANTSSGNGKDDGKDGSGGNIPIPDNPDEPTPPGTPKDMVDLLNTVESEEDLAQWREMLADMNLKSEVLHGLEYMAAKKEKELEERKAPTKQTVKEALEKMGLDADVAMYELGLSENDPYAREPAWPTPLLPLKDMDNFLETLESGKGGEQWRELLSPMNFSPEPLLNLEHLDLEKIRLLNYTPWAYYPEDLIEHIKDEYPTNYGTTVNEIIARVRAMDLNLKGEITDYRGVAIAEAFVPKGGEIRGVDATAVAAAIAVQSQWYLGGKDSKNLFTSLYDSLPGKSLGFGIAQITNDEMRAFGFEGQDQEDPEVAVQAMAQRINNVLEALSKNFRGKKCNAQDMLIAAALAQNGSGFTAKDIRDISADFRDPIDDSPDWKTYFGERGEPSADTAKKRQKDTGKQFDTQIMLKLYINDLRELHDRGWDLPYGLTEQALDEVEETYYTNLDLDLD